METNFPRPDARRPAPGGPLSSNSSPSATVNWIAQFAVVWPVDQVRERQRLLRQHARRDVTWPQRSSEIKRSIIYVWVARTMQAKLRRIRRRSPDSSRQIRCAPERIGIISFADVVV
jgi:hypothetical protein